MHAYVRGGGGGGRGVIEEFRRERGGGGGGVIDGLVPWREREEGRGRKLNIATLPHCLCRQKGRLSLKLNVKSGG